MTDTIIPRALLEQALKALGVATTPLAEDRQEVLAAVAALRSALEQPQQREPVKPPGMAVQALAGEIIEALLADEKDGYDLTAGLFGANFSALVRRWAAAEWNALKQPQRETK